VEKQIFVRVIGFSEAERHALNTVFRLSESEALRFSLWSDAKAGLAPPEVLLLDGESWEARLEMAENHAEGTRLVWIGPNCPGKAHAVFGRPLNWPHIVRHMNALLGGDAASQPVAKLDTPAEIDLDLSASPGDERAQPGGETQPQALAAQADAPGKRILIADSDRVSRLYLRAKLAAIGPLAVDEAATGAEALALLGQADYAVVLLDIEPLDMDGWRLLKAVQTLKPKGGHLIVMGKGLSWFAKARARWVGVTAVITKPPHPARLANLLRAATR
jgi:CheY-like chemotaxis protein